MKKRKTDYDAPDISVTQVEVESALCGSADIANPDNSSTGMIQSQTVNNSFSSGLNPDSYEPGDNAGNGWTVTTDLTNSTN